MFTTLLGASVLSITLLAAWTPFHEEVPAPVPQPGPGPTVPPKPSDPIPTPPPKPVFEEKMLFALLWNRNLAGFWRQELGEGFLARLKKLIPYTWLVDPAPLPPHAAIPELNLTDWQQLKTLSQKERDLILKVSGFSPPWTRSAS
mgnify:CR=1 FL=1